MWKDDVRPVNDIVFVIYAVMHYVEEARLVRRDGELHLISGFEILLSRVYSLHRPPVAAHQHLIIKRQQRDFFWLDRFRARFASRFSSLSPADLDRRIPED